MDDKETLYRELHSADPRTRELATQQLWQVYFGAAGPEAEIRLLHAEQTIESGLFEEAENLLTDLILDQPEFAEAWNRRATLYYLTRQYRASLADCEAATRLEPQHFGAWHGMGLVYLALHRFADAAQAFRRALEIQPFAQVNQELLARCLARLN